MVWYQVDSQDNQTNKSAPTRTNTNKSTTTDVLTVAFASHACTLTPKQPSGSTSPTRLISIGQTIWQGVIGHKRQRMAPLACICRKTSPSFKQQDKILRERGGSGASCGCECRVQKRQMEMKVRDFLFWHFSNVQLLPNNLSKSFYASLRACAMWEFVKSTNAFWKTYNYF